MSTIQPNIEQPVSEEMALVRRAKRGDDQAFEELVRRYDRNVFRIAQHITPVSYTHLDVYKRQRIDEVGIAD